MGVRAEHRWQAMLAREARERERAAHRREVTGQIAVTLAAAATAKPVRPRPSSGTRAVTATGASTANCEKAASS